MWKFGDQRVNPGQPWTGLEGVQHPGNWTIWSAEEKVAAGLIEIVEEAPPDSRFFSFSANGDGTYTSVPRDLDEVKRTQLAALAETQRAMLASTDWAFIRFADTGAAVPDGIRTYRDAVRACKAARMAAINGAGTLDELIAVVATDCGWPLV